MTLPVSAGAAAAGVRRVVIVGAGGFGREVRWWARDAWGTTGVEFAGHLGAATGGSDTALGLLGDPERYVPRDDEGFLLAIGIPGVRRRVAEGLASRGARFLTLVHPSAVVAPTARIAAGAVVCPGAVISDAAVVGPCALINYHASVAHDAEVGAFAVLSPYATLAGGARAGADAFLGLHASIGPGRTLGDRSKISANSCLLSDAPPDSIVYGVPGRVGPLLP
jgi:sugar O-acyltransferase (sialic acid O-acetyltransferase NeuD family)